MRSVDAAFLADICADPADRAPRLIYADWLDEHRGDDPAALARARFIRLQCQAETLDSWDGRYLRIKAEADGLLRQYAAEWTPDLPDGAVAEFRGGFVEGLTIAASDLQTRIEELLRRCPLRTLRLGDPHLNWRGFLESPLPAQLEDLTVITMPATELLNLSLDQLIDAYPRVRMLDLAHLTSGPVFPRLRAITLGKIDWDLPADDLVQACNRERMPALAALSLDGVSLYPEGWQRFVQSDLVERLRELAVSVERSEGASPSGTETLLAASWPELQSLTLTWTSTHQAAVALLARCPWLARLRRLHLSGSARIDDLLASDILSDHLEELELLGGTCPDSDPESVARQPWLCGLRNLALGGQAVAATVLRVLALCPAPPRLARLHLTDTSFWLAGGAPLLCAAVERTSPRSLEFVGCGQSLGWLPPLVASSALHGVQRLQLQNVELSIGGVQALLDSPHLDGLVALDLRDNPSIGPTWRERLRERFPFVEF